MFDTNVVVSGFLSPTGPPGRIVEWLRLGEVQAVVDDRIMAKYAEVLARPVFRLPASEVEVVLARIRTLAFAVETTADHLTPELPDPEDAPSLEWAKTAGVPLVTTGSTRHYPRATAPSGMVLTPAQFITSRREQSND